MRNLVLLLIGIMLGAALFHVYYLRLDPLARCSWDHPLDAEAKARCRDAAAVPLRRAACRGQSAKFNRKPGSGHSICANWPRPDRVMLAVRRSGPPKQILVG